MSGTTVPSNEQVMRAVMDAFEHQDVDLILSYYPEDDDFTYIDMAEPDQVLRGRDGMRTWLGEFWSMVDMTGAEMRLQTITSEGERVACEFELEATYVDGGTALTGERVLMRGCLVQRIVDGTIRQEHLYMASAVAPRPTGHPE
jgi:limonene-1,2-epoxide hydrolase